MSYCTGCSIRCPGHIVILIDGAANMATYYMDNETRISFVERCVNNIIKGLFCECISGISIKNRVFVSLYEYSEEGVILLLQDFIIQLCAGLFKIDKEAKLIEGLEVSHMGGGRLSDALDAVADELIFWKESIKEEGKHVTSVKWDKGTSTYIQSTINALEPYPAPLVLNFTKGFPTFDSESAVLGSIEKLKAVSYPDGVPLFYNILLPLYDERELYDISKEQVDKRWGLLYEISSDFPSYQKSRYRIDLEKGIILNPKDPQVIFDILVKPWFYPVRTTGRPIEGEIE